MKTGKNRGLDWDTIYSKLPLGRTLWPREAVIGAFIEKAKQAGVRRILDAGCGDGRNLTSLLADDEFQTVGCDASPHALALCRQEVQRVTRKSACLIPCKLEDMPFPDSAFDALICIDVINHNPEPYGIFSEFRRVVRSEGLVYFNLFNVEDPIFGIDMEAIPSKIDEYFYHGPYGPIYFKFVNDVTVHDFLQGTQLTILNVEKVRWIEPGHPYYREYPHEHSHFCVLARNVRK